MDRHLHLIFAIRSVMLPNTGLRCSFKVAERVGGIGAIIVGVAIPFAKECSPAVLGES